MPSGIYKRTKEAKRNMSLAHIGKKWTEEHKKNFIIAKLGHPVSEETKQRISMANKDKVRSKEQRKNISNSKIGRVGPWAGKKRPKFSKEWIDNIRKSKIGEKSYNWIKDRTKLQKYGDDNKDRRSGAYNYWRSQVYKRDNYTCQMASEDCKGRIIAHHIKSYTKYPELRYKINNGITLCQAHHPKKRAEEKALIPVFQELIPVS